GILFILAIFNRAALLQSGPFPGTCGYPLFAFRADNACVARCSRMGQALIASSTPQSVVGRILRRNCRPCTDQGGSRGFVDSVELFRHGIQASLELLPPDK